MARFVDEKTKAIIGRISVPWVSSNCKNQREIWRLASSDHSIGATSKKTICGNCGTSHKHYYDSKTCWIRDLSCGSKRIYLEMDIRRVNCDQCGKVKQEKLSWISDNPWYTKRFAFDVGRRCRNSTVQDVAEEFRISWRAVKDLDKQYMQAQLKRFGTPAPRVIGIDEISIKKKHNYRIVVSDLIRRRAIWFGGKNRKEKSMDMFYEWLGPKKSKKVQLAVMDMWEAFTNSAKNNIPQADILYDKFHIMKHLSDAMDEIRKLEYKRLTGKDRDYVKGHKYTLLSRKKNLTLKGRKALKELLKVNKRLNSAYLLKESFSQFWNYKREGWARRFFNNWKAALKGQQLDPFEEFAAMIETHWDGIIAYWKPENKEIPLGFVEGFNNKIRVIHRRAYGLKDEDYLRLKVLTCSLPKI